MTYFDTILANHNLQQCPKHLWQIKVTDDEYARLKDILSQETRLLGRMPFASVTRECALFFAEYWRREYIDGPHRISDVFAALPHANRFLNGINLVDKFYEEAQRGAKKLNLKIESVKSDRKLDSLLYQGGLPMAHTMNGQNHGGWLTFVKGLVNKNYDFENLRLSLTASQCQSMRDFCDQIWEAIDGNPDDMPFSVENEGFKWYQTLVSQFKEERSRQREEHPFSLDWIFHVNHIGKKVKIEFNLKGSQKLSQEFAGQEKLESFDFFTATVSKDGKIENVFDYYQKNSKQNDLFWFCNNPVVSRHTYRNGETVSLIFQNKEIPHISESLDLETPHLMFLQKDGSYALGNRIGKGESFLLIPEGWSVAEDSLLSEDYQWDGSLFKGIRIPADYTDSIQVMGADGVITFGYNEELFWTEISSSPQYGYPNVVESVYDARNVKFSLCRDGVETTIKSSCNIVEYRGKHDKEWTYTPKYGEIFARVKQRDGRYVTPVRLLNIGDGLEINIPTDGANAEVCKLQVKWPYGKVVCLCGEKCSDDTWQIKKTDCKDPRRIPFTFIPEGNANSQFTLNIKAPFREFFIEDNHGHRVENGCYIPFQDLSQYQYHIVGDIVRCIRFGAEENVLCWYDETLHIKDRATPTSRIVPYEGSLATLLGSRKVIKEMLDKTSKNLPDATVSVVIKKNDGSDVRLTIKEFPFKAEQDNENIHIKKRGCHFYDSLRLFCINNPKEKPVVISANEDGDFTLPDAVYSWGKILVTADSQGRLLPAMADLTRNLTDVTRQNERAENIERIIKELSFANMADEAWQKVFGWYENCLKYDIPATSLLDLVAVGCSSESLIRFAFKLYINVYTKTNDSDDEDSLIQKLQGMSNELAIQWFWILPEIHHGVQGIVEDFVDSLSLQKIFIQWVKNENAPELYGLLGQDEPMKALCMPPFYHSFESWLKKLCFVSARDVYFDEDLSEYDYFLARLIEMPNSIRNEELRVARYVNENQEVLGEETKKFFKSYEEKETGSRNEKWMNARAAVVHNHLTGKINLFEPTLNEIRRSVIFCYKSSTLLFLESLNNKLSKENYI